MDNKTMKDISSLFRKWLLNYRSGDGGSALNDDDLEIAFFVGYNSGQSEELDLQNQLDEVTKVKERYEKAVKFYSDLGRAEDDSNYSWYTDTDNNVHLLEVRDNECFKIGDLAREALNGGGE